MRKKRLIYAILSLILSLFVYYFTYLFPSDNDILLYFMIGLILVPNFTMRKTEKNLILSIMGSYAINCDAKAYLKNIQKYYKECFFTKKAKHYHKVTLAMINMDLGQFEEAKKLLMEVVETVEKFNDFQKYNYYRAWTTYYFEFKEYNHMKVLVDEMQKIVDRANGEVKIQLLSNFLIVQAKYFIGEGIYLDKAKNVYNDVLSGNTPPILRLSAHYYLGLINFKTNNFEKAKEEFKYVACSEKNIYLVEKSKKYLEVIENINN